MIERLVGAVAAIAAAALLVAGAVTSAWWQGRSTVGGAAEATIGLRSEALCFTKHEATGKPRCSEVTTTDCDATVLLQCKSRGTTAHSTVFGVCGWGATVLGALAALLLAMATASAVTKGRAAARGVAIGGAVFGVLGGLAAGGFVLLRPDLPGFEGEIGWSAWAYFGGAGAALLSSIILGREEREAREEAPRERVSRERAAVSASRVPASRVSAGPASGSASGRKSKPASAAAADFDVAALFAEDEESARPGPPPRAPAPPVVAKPPPAAEASLFAPDLPAPRLFSAAQAEGPPQVSLFAPEPPLQSGVRGPAGLTEAPGLERPVFGQSRVTQDVRADTERDLPPDDMQGTPAPEPHPLAFMPPLPARTSPPTAPPPPPPATGPVPRTSPPTAPPPMRAKAPSMPPPPPVAGAASGKPLPPLPRAKAPSLPPAVARLAASTPSVPPPPASRARAASGETDPEPQLVGASRVTPTPTPGPAAGADATPGPVPACPQCDAPTDWNEEHLRFFCRKCRIYL